MLKKVFIYCLAALVLFLVLFNCKKKIESFNIGFNEWVGFAPFFLAKEKGFYGDLNVQLHFIALEGDKRAGLYAGRFQMICETMDMFQTNREEPNYPGKIIFAIDESFGGDGVVAIKEVQSLKDIKGRTVVSEPGQPAHFVLQFLLHKEGMTLKDVNLQTMTSADAAAAFIARKADVAGTYEPYLSKTLEKVEGSHLLVSSKDLSGLIVDVAIVLEKTIEKRKQDVIKLYKGWCQAVEFFEKNPEESTSIMANAFKLKPEEFKDTISGLRYFGYSRNLELFGTPNKPGPIIETFKNIGVILKENILTKITDPPKEKIDLTIANIPFK